jgi:hypothetical protein
VINPPTTNGVPVCKQCSIRSRRTERNENRVIRLPCHETTRSDATVRIEMVFFLCTAAAVRCCGPTSLDRDQDRLLKACLDAGVVFPQQENLPQRPHCMAEHIGATLTECPRTPLAMRSISGGAQSPCAASLRIRVNEMPTPRPDATGR